MATLNKRINTPIKNPLTTQNLRSVANSAEPIWIRYPNIAGGAFADRTNVGQQIGSTISDPLGFKTAIEGLQADISAGIPGFLVGAAVLIVGVLLLWTGLQAFIIPTAGKVVGAVAKAAS